MKKILNSSIEKIKQNIIPLIEEELIEWPPTCNRFLFQAERPVIKSSEESDD